MQITDTAAIVTGGVSGLGAATAAALAAGGARVFAFTTHTDKWFSDVEYQEGDVLLFGTEPTGLPEEHAFHPRVTERVRIPMMPARRSMNLSNAASTAVYEAWRQLGFRGAV